MNTVDYIILGVIGVSVLLGIYRGFIHSVLNMGGTLLSLFGAFALSPRLAEYVQSNPELQRTLLTYTDASSRLGDVGMAMVKVSQLTQDTIAQIVSKCQLPPPLDSLLSFNLQNQTYQGIDSVQEYVSQTIVSACVDVLSFVVCFALCMLAVTLLGGMIKAVFSLPVLKQLDHLAGGAMGLLRGLIICFVLFALVPLILTVVPVPAVSEAIDASTLAPVFAGVNLINAIMNGGL